MKKRVAFYSFIFLSVAFFFSTCKKDTTANLPDEPVKTDPPVFNWRTNNGTTLSSDSTFYYPSINTIYAFRRGLGNSLEIILSAFNTGTYTISQATGNTLSLVSGSVTLNATSGKVIINSNTNNKLSGTVNAAFSNTTITSMSGEFTDIPARN